MWCRGRCGGSGGILRGQLVQLGFCDAFTLAEPAPIPSLCPFCLRTLVSLCILAGCELAPTPLAFPLWQAFHSFFGHFLPFTSGCLVPLMCKSLLLLLGLRLVPLAFGEIEKGLWAFLIEKL
jgi:hypothetical protein